MRALLGLCLLALSACAGSSDPLARHGSHPLDATIWDIASGQPISAADLASRLAATDISIIGEIHDNAVHHGRQAWLVEQISPQGIAFEMVPEGSEEGIAVLRAQGAPATDIGPAIGWDRLGWPDWELYSPVFAAADQAYIAGGGVPRADITRAIKSGAVAAYGKGAVEVGLAQGFSQATQTELEREMIVAHCNLLPQSAAVGMVEAQRLRDARFAEAVVRAGERGAGRAVLITGNGHARNDRGVPRYLEVLVPEKSVRSLGMLETDAGASTLSAYPDAQSYDFVWFAPPVDRGDPCSAFAK